jgi:hypothetical protein
MTNHYQHANATKATKYIQHYNYQKSSLKYETTENEREHKIPRNILFFGPYKSSEEEEDIILLSAHTGT